MSLMTGSPSYFLDKTIIRTFSKFKKEIGVHRRHIRETSLKNLGYSSRVITRNFDYTVREQLIVEALFLNTKDVVYFFPDKTFDTVLMYYK